VGWFDRNSIKSITKPLIGHVLRFKANP
jgi:hypothetical protein